MNVDKKIRRHALADMKSSNPKRKKTVMYIINLKRGLKQIWNLNHNKHEHVGKEAASVRHDWRPTTGNRLYPYHLGFLWKTT